MLIVQKFGGSSLADAGRIRRAARRAIHAAQEGAQVVAVVSAQGDTTDHLISAAAAVNTKPSARELDAYLATGEQMSACLMVMALEAMGQSAISLTGWQAGLLTDDVHGDARVRKLMGNRIQQELEAGRIVVVTGFQGIDDAGDITTLGRGGSDTTAVALAAFLGADKCQIYTDVDGIYDRDPRIFPDAVRFDTIGYDAMLTLARQGAQVLHDRSVELARDHGLKVEVLSAFTDASIISKNLM
jgi:aspartate kinase